ERRPTPDPTFISYAAFGRRFFEVAVTRDRVAEAVAGIGGRPIEVGPMGVGPLSLAKVRANGMVGEPELVEIEHDEHIAFQLVIPVELQLKIGIGLDTYRFNADMRIRLPVAARAAERLRVVIDVEPPTRHDVEVELRADGLRASALQAIANVEQELKRTVAKFVAKEIEKGRDERIIDVEQALSKMT
ncbi:MAG TPA: hypothetical protein VFH38_00760, partial [Jatrophihabitans sp.]|nr:hypothetical protein [Jatrophihabitans sp.]